MRRPESDIAFSTSVKAAQQQRISREVYAGMKRRGGWQSEVTADLADSIAQRDAFYMATAGAEGQPYIQHRGGPKGFLKVLDEHTLAFADFVGNTQYISIGNLDENNQAFILWIADHAGFETAADISADGVNRYAGKLRDEGRAARTIQAHLNAIKAFTKWLTEHHKLPRDPLSSVKKPNPKADRRRERRMLLPEEWRRLETALIVGTDSYGMTSIERITLYQTAIQTGLRSNELRSLTRGSLYLDADKLYITCKAKSTKNRKDARQYIQLELATALRTLIDSKAPKAPVFNLPHESNLARMLRDDLAAARKAWFSEAKDDPEERLRREQSDFLTSRNHEGESLDFHSLRHTCGAWLAMTGAHPKVVQQVMRHSTITLTMDTYGHLFPGQEANAVARLQDMLTARLPESLQATGTDDLQILNPKVAQHQAQHSERETGQSSAIHCDEGTNLVAQKKTPKPLQIADLSDVVQENATLFSSSGGGIRSMREFPGENVRSRICWGFTGDNSG